MLREHYLVFFLFSDAVLSDLLLVEQMRIELTSWTLQMSIASLGTCCPLLIFVEEASLV